jgi:steroid 5-alpha reductase family enzyme
MPALAEVLLTTLLAVAISMALLWLVSLALRDASIVDIYWGLGFVLIAWVAYAVADVHAARSRIVTLLTTLWGARLATHLAWRNAGRGEDFRYAQMRRNHAGRFWLVSLYLVFGLQGLLMWVVSFPIQAAQVVGSAVPLGALDALGGGLWAVGIGFEAVGDWQLAHFRADPANRGRVCDRGLWGWTRHPNYFGDAVMWWGLYCFAAAAGATWTAIGPLVMTVLLLEVSGVAMLERSLRDSRPGYADYVARTSAFFPLPPRRGQATRER